MNALIPKALNGGHQGEVVLSISLFLHDILASSSQCSWTNWFGRQRTPFFLFSCPCIFFPYFSLTFIQLPYISPQRNPSFIFPGKQGFFLNDSCPTCSILFVMFLPYAFSQEMHVCILCDFMGNHFVPLLSIFSFVIVLFS